MNKTEAEQVQALLALVQHVLALETTVIGQQTVLYGKARDAAIDLGGLAHEKTGQRPDADAIRRAWPNPFDF